MSILDDPEHWRERAKESGAVAELLSDPVAKETMPRIAEAYERLAANAQLRASGLEAKQWDTRGDTWLAKEARTQPTYTSAVACACDA